MGAHFDIGQVQVAFEQMIGEVAPDRGTPFAFRLTRRKVTDEMAFHKDGMFLDAFGEDHNGDDAQRSDEHNAPFRTEQCRSGDSYEAHAHDDTQHDERD